MRDGVLMSVSGIVQRVLKLVWKLERNNGSPNRVQCFSLRLGVYVLAFAFEGEASEKFALSVSQTQHIQESILHSLKTHLTTNHPS